MEESGKFYRDATRILLLPTFSLPPVNIVKTKGGGGWWRRVGMGKREHL